MSVDDMDSVGGALELEKKRLANPWLLLASLIFVVGFLLGWRSVAKSGSKSAAGSSRG